MDLRLLEAEATSEVQLLIVGSSHVYRGIDPRRFEERGISAFNFGSSLQSPIQTEYLLKKYLDQMNPDMVLFEVGYKTFSTNGIEGALDVIINSPALDWDILDMALEVNDISVYNTLAYTLFRKNVLGETREDYLSKHTELDEYIPGGFVMRRDSVYVGPESFDKTIKPLQALQQESFEKCLTMLKERNIKTILVQTPILRDYYNSIENIDEFNSYFSKLSGSYHYYNFNEDIYKETKYFYDHHHLNAIGVDRFNSDLIEAIAPHLDVLSRR